MLYRLSERYRVPCRKVGKWIIASSEEEAPKLSSILKIGTEAGVPLRFLSEREVAEEPKVRANTVLFSPETGIVDSHELMSFFHHTIESNGALVALRTRVEHVALKSQSGGYLVQTVDEDGEESLFETEVVVNAAGLSSDKIATQVMGDKFPQEYKLHYCKGHYLSYTGPMLLKVPRLLYPVPEPGLRGLGVHATVNMAGAMRFGPDTKYIDHVDYNFDDTDVPNLVKRFQEAISKYIPSIEAHRLRPDYTGIRPKLAGPGDTSFKDFIINLEAERGFPGLVNLIGIESPGLTASLAIAEKVAGLLDYKERDEFEAGGA